MPSSQPPQNIRVSGNRYTLVTADAKDNEARELALNAGHYFNQFSALVDEMLPRDADPQKVDRLDAWGRNLKTALDQLLQETSISRIKEWPKK